MEDTDENLAKLEERISVIEGRVRAIEALMLEMPGMTQELIQAAKDGVRLLGHVASIAVYATVACDDRHRFCECRGM